MITEEWGVNAFYNTFIVQTYTSCVASKKEISFYPPDKTMSVCIAEYYALWYLLAFYLVFLRTCNSVVI